MRKKTFDSFTLITIVNPQYCGSTVLFLLNSFSWETFIPSMRLQFLFCYHCLSIHRVSILPSRISSHPALLTCGSVDYRADWKNRDSMIEGQMQQPPPSGPSINQWTARFTATLRTHCWIQAVTYINREKTALLLFKQGKIYHCCHNYKLVSQCQNIS